MTNETKLIIGLATAVLVYGIGSIIEDIKAITKDSKDNDEQ